MNFRGYMIWPLIIRLALTLSQVSNLWPTGRGMAVNAAQCKIVNVRKIWWDFLVWLRVTVYLMCGPRQLFFQCGPATPKGWTPLLALVGSAPPTLTSALFLEHAWHGPFALVSSCAWTLFLQLSPWPLYLCLSAFKSLSLCQPFPVYFSP